MAKSIWCLAVTLMLCFAQSENIENSSKNNHTKLLSSEWSFKDYQPLWPNALLLLVFLLFFVKKPFGLEAPSIQSNSFKIFVMIGELIVKTLVGACVCLLFIPLVLPVYLVLWISKKFVECLVYFQYRNAIIKSTGTDIMWGSGPEVSEPFISVVLKFEGSPDMSFFKETVAHKVLNYVAADGGRPFRKFKQTYDTYYGFFFWRDCEHFNIDNHVKLVNLTELYPGMDDTDTLNQYLKCSDKLVCQYVGDVGFRRLPADQPQWEINFLTKNNEDGYTLYFKLHHAIGDGMSLLRLLMEHLADDPVKVSMLPELPQSPLQRFLYNLWSITFMPFSSKFLMLDRTPNPLLGKKLSGNKVMVTSEPIPLDLIRSIKDQTNTTVTEVLFSCLSYAVASHFKRKSSSVERVNIFFPVGFENINAPITMSNKFTIGVCSLPTIQDKELLIKYKELRDKDPAIGRIFKIKKSLDAVKRGPIVLALYNLSVLIVNVLPISLASVLFTSNGLTLACSNVPGPRHEIYAMKRKMTAMRFWVPDREPNGCGVTFMSYNGQVRLGISVDDSFIDSRRELEMIVDDFGLQLLKLSDELKINQSTQNERTIKG